MTGATTETPGATPAPPAADDRGPVPDPAGPAGGEIAADRDVPARARPPGPGRRMLAIAAGVALLGAAGVAGWRWRAAATARAAEAEPRDVPRQEGRAIWISDAYRRRVGITFGAVEHGSLVPRIKVVGTVELDPRRVAAVGIRIPGFVRRVFKLEGDHVRAGDALAETESAELGQAQAGVTAALAEKYAAEVNARRETLLLSSQLTTAREAEEAQARLASREAALAAARQSVEAMGGRTEGRLGLRVLRSPITGHVIESSLSVGQSVDGHKVAFRIANLDTVWVELEVFERTLGMVRVGDAVEVIPVADPDRRIKGTVAHVGEIIDLTSRSAEVRVEVDNRDRLLRPGQSVTALIRISGPARQALTVPADALTYVDDTPTVFLAETPNRIVPTKVSTGLTDGVRQEVLAGLRPSDQVVTAGVFALKSELFR